MPTYNSAPTLSDVGSTKQRRTGATSGATANETRSQLNKEQLEEAEGADEMKASAEVLRSRKIINTSTYVIDGSLLPIHLYFPSYCCSEHERVVLAM